MLLKLIKLPLKGLALPLILIALVLQVIGSLVIGLSSIVTHLLSTFFLLGAVAGWIAHGSASIIWQSVGLGIFFLIVPHLASWLLTKIAGLMGGIVGFLLS